MILVRLLIPALDVALLLVVACGDGPGDPLVPALPGVMPDQAQASQETGGQWQLAEISENTGKWTNQDVADALGVSIKEVADSGRVDGYRATYQGGPSPEYPLVSVSLTLSVYRDEESAEAALRKGPGWSTGPPVVLPAIGDAALSWPTLSVSADSIKQEPACPCELWVRVGRLVGTVDVGFGGPLRIEKQASREAVALARIMAARMADAQS